MFVNKLTVKKLKTDFGLGIITGRSKNETSISPDLDGY